MNLERELHRLVDDALSNDPRIALVACRKLAVDHLPWLTDRAVLSARSDRDKRYFEQLRHERLTAELRHWETTGVGIVAW